MDKIFIEQAKNIRREYIKNHKELLRCEEQVEKYKQSLLDIRDHINMKDKKDEEYLREQLTNVEKNISYIEKIMEPFRMKIEQMGKDADRLYDNIKSRHPELTKEQIQNELIPHLIEIKF